MKHCLIFLLILLIITTLFIKKERYKDYPVVNNIYSCWEYLMSKNWNVNNLDDGQKKVLLTLRTLNSTIYSDDNREFPNWQNKCVIPSYHLPIYNIDQNKTDDWIIDDNNKLQYTNNNENPKGFIIDLKDEKSFKKLLSKLYELYDKEFADEEKRLSDLIEKQIQIKNAKTIKLNEIKNNITTQQAILNSMLDPNSECQQNKKIRDDLQTQIDKVRADITSIEQSMPVVPPYPPPFKKNEQNEEYSWKCKSWSDVKMYTPTGKNSSGDVQCMSENARDCFWFNDKASCINKINNPPQNINPLVCGQNHKEQWDSTGYDNPTHWCSTYNKQKGPVVELWQHCDYNGWKISLKPGKYTLNKLQSLGFVNDDASSIRFLKDGSITVFTDDNFQGTQQTFTNSINCLIDFNLNDTISSVIVT